MYGNSTMVFDLNAAVSLFFSTCIYIYIHVTINPKQETQSYPGGDVVMSGCITNFGGILAAIQHTSTQRKAAISLLAWACLKEKHTLVCSRGRV